MVPNPKKGAAANASAGGGGFVADPESLMMLCSMGFTDKQATRALRKCEGNLERAADWVMSHMDEPDSEEEDAKDDGAAMDVDQVKSVFAGSEESKASGLFRLQSFVTHLGSSVHAGHYVAHARNTENDAQWIYFNDAKVALDPEPPTGKGYMYFLRNLASQ